jgi:hypothetical protein
MSRHVLTLWSRSWSRRLRLPLAVALVWVVVGHHPQPGHARVNPLSVIERQVQKPNMLILLDTSASMIFLPGEKEAEMTEAGPDCDNGDSYCRTVGTQNRCFFSNGGNKGAGVFEDATTCTTNSQCNSKGYCRFHAPYYCTSYQDCCSSSSSCSCTNNICSNSGTVVECTTHDDCDPGESCTLYTNDFCVTNSTTAARIKMCAISMKRCLDNSHCTTAPGDVCGNASSRMVIAKRALNAVVQDFATTVNFGFMTFTQSGYYPYYKITSGVTNVTRTAYLDQATLEAAVVPSTTTPCWTKTGGPTSTCSLNNVTYTRVASNNSRYRLNQGGYYTTTDASWSATCQTECNITGTGTGLYQGSYYTYTFADGSPDYSQKQTFSDYVGRTRSYSGSTYMYYESPASVRNKDNVYLRREENPKIPISSASGSGCGDTKGATFNSAMVPFMDTAATLSTTKAKTMALKLAQVLAKASEGGVIPDQGTPSGCALKNSGDGASYQYSAYHYLEKVKGENATNGVQCRPNYVLFLTDGVPSSDDGPDCASAACATSPPGSDCDCKAVHSARSIYSTLGAKVYMIGFSSTLTNTYGRTTLDNIARAGGTDGAYFAVNETELYTALSKAIYDATKGSYATSPISVGAADAATPSVMANVVLDTRADFPAWKGHLIAYDGSAAAGTPPLWDASTFFDQGATITDESGATVTNFSYWKNRNVWTSNGSAMVKIQVDPVTGTILNAAELAGSTLFNTTAAEAALIARWLLGDPAMKNPAVLGAIINSTPTQVGKAPDPSLTYAGASDGMLHAFHSRTQTVGGVKYRAGTEAFAYIPQDMLPLIRRLYAQGGQLADPREHLYGLANSAKVRKICTGNCTTAGSEQLQTILIMPEGFGGNDVFALDISAPFGTTGIKNTVAGPPVTLLWNTEKHIAAGQQTNYNNAMGKAISLPGFYYGKSATKDEYRSIFASGYTEASSSAIGLQIINAKTTTGVMVGSTTSVKNLGASCSKTPVDPTEPTVLADIAVARRFGSTDQERIAAAYVGDTWGNLFRYVPTADTDGNIASSGGAVSVVDSFTCNHPLHFAPTIVQLDRHDPTKNAGQIFIAQVTNSPLDLNTDQWDTGFPASQLIIRKDIAAAGSAVNADSTWGVSGARIVLNANNSAQICGVWNSTTNTCTTPLPNNARPMGSPLGILRDDFDGFALVTLWYVPNLAGCSKGESYLTIHEITVQEASYQIHGEKIADEPVVGAVFAAGKLMVVTSQGPKSINTNKLGGVNILQNTGATNINLVDRYRRYGWTEVP